jgi:membrane protease YdiL (CAAX protease family)
MERDSGQGVGVGAAAGGVGVGVGRRDPGSVQTLALAWTLFAVLLVVTTALQWMGASMAGEGSGVEAALEEPSGGGGITLLLGRYAVGADQMFPGQGTGEGALETVEASIGEGAGPGLRLAVLHGEIRGAEAALEQLAVAEEETRELAALAAADAAEGAAAGEGVAEGDGVGAGEGASVGEGGALPAWFEEDLRALRGIYEAGSAEAAGLEESARAALVERHGWFGELALAHGLEASDPARSSVVSRGTFTLVTVGGVVMIALVAFATGVVLWILAVAGVRALRMRGGYSAPSPGGSAYLEVGPLFLLGFLLVGIAAGAVQQASGLDLSWLLVWLLLPIAMWPVLRGSPWRNWRYACGWHAGRGVAREVGAGFVGYLMALPIFAIGVLAMFVLMGLWTAIFGAEDGPTPSHPIVEEMTQAGWWGAVKVYLLAAVWAPVVEETVFRGALYHHLRGWMAPIGAALVTGFIFAVIHPQGLVAIPALMALGVAFALIREWRGSIIAPIVAHALHNGALMTMLLLGTA